VADDEPDFVAFAAAILGDHGARVLEAHGGEEALAIARRERPDLMTLDLSMPGLSGVEVFLQVRRDPQLAELPIMIVTGQPEMRRLIYDRPERAPEGYLDKPVGARNLLMNVRKVLEVRRS
jgi:CheY-like chemotaxis protein